MITIEHQPASDNASNAAVTRITLSPNRSLSWEGNKRVIWSLAALIIFIAIGFSVVTGTWVIWPFAVFKILALSAGLYYVSWKLSYQHTITVSESTLSIEKGSYRPRGSWQWQKQQSRLITTESKHNWEAPSLVLSNDKEEVVIGNFLSRDDAMAVIDCLKNEMPVVNNCYNADQ
ncbi:MAG TPA: DUF2244 domain-containing protein [Cellvibrionales bacterium]|nr:DUF2244 domain-containing protein [Cellvibrionales bacterium]